MAKTYVKHYYGQRLLEGEFWVKLFRGEVNAFRAIRTFVDNLKLAGAAGSQGSITKAMDFQDRMAEGLRSFQHPVLLILSGRDLTAKEFLEHAQINPRWAGLLERTDIARHDLPESDHTFSTALWAKEVETCTLSWLQSSFA